MLKEYRIVYTKEGYFEVKLVTLEGEVPTRIEPAKLIGFEEMDIHKDISLMQKEIRKGVIYE